MNGNVTKEVITVHLEAMARFGIGGVLIFNVAGSHGTDITAGPIDYLSEEWLDLVKYTARPEVQVARSLCQKRNRI